MNLADFEKFKGTVVYGRMMEKRNKRLKEFLNEHQLADPKSIEYSPLLDCEMANCFRNVEAQVKIAGGRIETGWAFYELIDISIHTVAHAVWVTPASKRKDITPWRHPPEKRILFFAGCRSRVQTWLHGGLAICFCRRRAIPSDGAF